MTTPISRHMPCIALVTGCVRRIGKPGFNPSAPGGDRCAAWGRDYEDPVMQTNRIRGRKIPKACGKEIDDETPAQSGEIVRVVHDPDPAGRNAGGSWCGLCQPRRGGKQRIILRERSSMTAKTGSSED